MSFACGPGKGLEDNLIRAQSRKSLFEKLKISFQFSKSNSSQVTLMNLDFDATGSYYCEVSIDNPIFTKASSEAHLHVIGEWRLACFSTIREFFAGN